MKKITMMFFMALCTLTGYAQMAMEGFEGSWPPTGWSIQNIAGPSQQWQQANNSAAQPAFEGVHAAFMNKENVATGTQSEDWLITPAVNIPSNAQLRFYSRLTVNGDQGTIYKVMIGTSTNVADFTEVTQWTETSLNAVQQEYEEKVVAIPATYTGQSLYIAFVMMGDDGDRWLVDNVSVVEQCLDPTNLTATNVGLDGADLSWSGTASSWEIEVIPATQTPTGTGVEWSGSFPYEVTGLDSNTAYRYYVKAICSTGAESNWVGPFNFTTVGLGESCTAPIEIASLPYSTTDNTSNYANNYTGVPGTSGCATSSWESYLYGNDVVYSYTPGFTGTVQVNLNNAGNYSGVFVYDSCEDIGVSCIGGAVTGWQYTSATIPTLAVTAGTTYYIVISNYIYQTNPYNLVLQQVTCTPPVGLPTTNMGMTSADLSWTNPTGATAWQVVVQAPGAGIPTGSGTPATTNTNFTVSGLTQATPYEYYVRSDCGDGTFSQWAGPYTFNTMVCEAADQCTYTFVLTDSFGDGWNGNTMNVTQNGVLLTTLSLTSGTGPVEVAVQMCDGIPFELYWNTGGSWSSEVGVSIHNNYDQTFFTKAPGVGSPGSSLYTGTVVCDTPMCLPPTALTATNISQTTATLGWAGPATGNWEYYVVPNGDPAPTAATAGTATTTNPVTATGLTEATEYQYYVRMICSDTQSSEWAGPFDFSTLVCPAEQQCNYTFTMLSDWWGGWYGANMIISQNGTTVAVIGSTFTSGQSQEITVPLCNNVPFEVYWDNGGSWSFQVGLSITNSFDQTFYTMDYGSETPGSVIYSGTADCLTPLCLPPTGLTVNGTTTTTADLAWDGQATGNWEYYIVPAGDPAPTDATAGVLTTTNGTTATGLTAATNYEYYLRMVCSDTESSDWAGPFAFHTQVCEAENQCTYTFEMTHSQGWGNSGNTFTVYQAGVPVATFGSDFTWGYSMTYDVALCPGEEINIVLNNGGWSTQYTGLVVHDSYNETFFTLPAGGGTLGATVFTGTPSCDPPLCPMPQNLSVDNIDLTTAEFGWTEMGSATQWEVLVLPYGSSFPLATDTGVVTSDNPYSITGLTPGTPYTVYVRAVCGGDNGNSNWAGPVNFVTDLSNDDCAGAVTVPVNSGADCTEFVSGTLLGSTGSGLTPSCNSWSTIEYDAWFSFTATNSTHSISINNAENIYPYFTVYSGECGEFEEIYCGFDDGASVSGLTPGETYYVMVYVTWMSDPTAINSFDLCVATPAVIELDNSTYTVPELVSEVLVNSLCATVSNVTWSTGGDSNNLTTGIAKFGQGNSEFGIEEGVVLASGNAMDSAGPNLSTLSSGGWGGDSDLFNYIQAEGIDPTLYSYNDATVLEFDFVPLSSHIKFPFIFASEEYGTFQCSYSDAFAFFLTDANNVTTNLALIPGTGDVVSVITIRDNLYNSGCDSQNVEWFDAYYNSPPGMPAASAPINYNGVTKKMYAESDVIVGNTYHIKLVIADRNDTALNSAVFIGPFDIGDVDLGADLTIDANTALCSGGTATINAGLDPEEYSFTWYNGTTEIVGETGPTLTVSEEGEYTVVAHYFSSTCETSDSIVVEFYDPVEVVVSEPQDLTQCDASGYDQFDLTVNDAVVLDGVENASEYQISYYATEADATAGTNPLTSPYTNTTQFLQTVYVRAFNTTTGCNGVAPFDLIVQTVSPEFTVSSDVSICEGTSTTIVVTPGNYLPEEVTYTWTHDGDTLSANTSEITVTEGGAYEVVVNKSGCVGTATVNVTVVPTPVADVLTDVTECGHYILPALSAGNAYYTGTGGTGTMLAAGDAVTTVGANEIFVLASSGTTPNCTAETSFTVTITPAPEVTAPDDVVACDSYTLPALAVADYKYYAQTLGVNEIPVGTVISADQTIFVGYTTPDGCFGEDSFTVTITPTPTPVVPADVTVCDSYTVGVIPAGNAYYAQTGSVGPIVEGDVITGTQTIYVVATNGSCSAEGSFTVTVVPTPVPAVLADLSACNSYTIGAIPAGNAYWTGAGATGTQLVQGDVITTSQTIYVVATSGSCVAEGSFTVTIDTLPVITTPGNQTVCDQYVLPALTAGGYYAAAGGTSPIAEGTTVYETQTIYVYATNGVCVDEQTFVVTVTPTPLLSVEVPVTTECDGINFVLTAVFDDAEEVYNSDNVTYAWTNTTTGAAAGTGESIVITAVGLYEVVVTPNGNTACAVSATIQIDDTSCAVQRGISPNNDGQNDNFDLSNLDVNKLEIFNRYGKEVYSFKGAYTNQWGGQTSGGDELPTGTYFYMYHRTTGESKTGWIYINREIK
ncbi:choice-of-anchor L domain-containing protein [Flavobacterium sp. RHBU_3]|uniref:choice-of-anchor L domain-containing protein n=1 Tax=Flavobacterium sp. RHBU_3 TaxID=3391184 RepID=UPI00398482C2